MQPQYGGGGFQPPPAKSKSLLIIIILVVLLLGAISFGAWAFSGRQDYKNNTDAKIAVAVAAAQKAEDAKQLANYNEQLKKPYKTYTGSSTFGSISFSYPLTYSAYIDTSSQSQPIEGYFYPGMVPGIQGDTAFALRVELVDTPYSQVVSQFSSDIQTGTLTSAAYAPPKLKGVSNVQPGTLLTGQVGQDSHGNPQSGEMVVIPVRDKTLQIYTESSDFFSDFNNIVLPSLTFQP